MASQDGDVADLLVIFGITGDLAQKMTFRSLYRLEQHRLLDFPILGVARGTMPTDELVKRAREAIINSGEHPDEAVAAMPERGKGARSLAAFRLCDRLGDIAVRLESSGFKNRCPGRTRVMAGAWARTRQRRSRSTWAPLAPAGHGRPDAGPSLRRQCRDCRPGTDVGSSEPLR